MLFAEIFGHEALALFEDAVEVGEAGEAALLGDLGDGGGGVDEQPGCMTDADVVEIVDEGDAGLGLEETAESGFGHLDEIGGLGKADRPAEMFVDEVDDLLDPLAVVVDEFGVIGDVVAEGAGVGRERQIVEDRHQLEHGVETFFFAERFEPRRDPFDSAARKGDALQRAFEQTADKIQLVPFEKDLVKEVAVKLNRDLEDALAFALVGKPGMRDVGTHEHQLQAVDLFHAAADDAADALGVFDKIQLVLLVIMHREIELGLIPGVQGEAIGFCQRWTFFENRSGHRLRIKIGFFCR
jgi:hypothetical protein